MVHRIQDREVGDLGFGLMGLTWGKPQGYTHEDAFKVMKAALEAGCNYWNGGEFYGPPDDNSMTLLNAYFERYPEDVGKVVLNVKGCAGEQFKPDASREGVRRSVENCLRMLGGKGKIDQFEPARKDPSVDIETTMAALKELVDEGKIGGITLSEVSAETIRRAAKVGKVEGVEVELSLWETSPLENGVAKACAELEIPILAYSPLGRGALSGKLRSIDDLPPNDFRRMMPRFQPEVFPINLKLVSEVEKLAAAKGATASQVALSWILELSKRPGMPRIIPIPGTTSVERLKENTARVALTASDMAAIDSILAEFDVIGDRYHAHGMALLDTA